jgi:hydroxymethylpyrimidine pyrophosphatase-like HAD family hydrolase
MLAPSPARFKRPAQEVLPEEFEFYASYAWCLNPYLTVTQASHHLRGELTKIATMRNGWQLREVATNIFLLSCGLTNCVDTYLRGAALRLPARAKGTLLGRGATQFVETMSMRPWSRRKVRRWRERWRGALDEFLSAIVRFDAGEAVCFAESGRKLLMRLESPLPSELQGEIVGAPTAFNRLDLTEKDILALGKAFVRRFPERTQSIVVVGLRTSGSYFAPLVSALLQVEGYKDVVWLTTDPNKGASRQERSELARFAKRGYSALIVDDPPYTCRTVLTALGTVSRAGFLSNRIRVLAATHPAKRTWFRWLPEDCVVTLLPEEWHKRQLLKEEAAELRLAEYFRGQNFTSVSITRSHAADAFNASLQSMARDERSVRLKRVFELQLVAGQGNKQTKYVLAKSVGWGWLGYHAFLAGCRLKGHVPPILGLRDGILYLEWIPQRANEQDGDGRRIELIRASASYAAARKRQLKLGSDTPSGVDLKRYNNGLRLLGTALSRAYGPLLADRLMQARLGELLRRRPCPSHTLIDGNMQRHEWVFGAEGPLKTDFEHHGMGKAAPNLTDPAYDLADTILNLALSPGEERDLITRYIAESGDSAVAQRLFMHKLLAGLWAMNEVQDQLPGSARGSDMQRECHRRFMNAWNFLTVHAARHCGSLCHSRIDRRWRAPLVLLDIDGVLDRRIFGFPCTTVAGMKALSLLSAHDVSVALNTARSAAEVKDYCAAYSLAGGVAEHGSYLWDAVHQRERILISAETARQLEELRRHLQRVPGIFLDERHRYSIRAFTYRDKPLGLLQSLLNAARLSSIGDGAMAPISTQVIHALLADLGLDRLTFHHTLIDTAILAKEADKGSGLLALRDWVLDEDAETIAVGDGESDLSMFRVATRSFAPANIACRRQAQLLGCHIVSRHDQGGLLQVARKIVHCDGGRCGRCIEGGRFPLQSDDLFLSLLGTADRSVTANLVRAMFAPSAVKMLIH